MKNPHRTCPRRPDRGNHGIALIAVLWLVTLLTLLGTAMATVSISQRRAAERYIQAVQAETIADSAIRLTSLKVFTTTQSNAPLPVSRAPLFADERQLLGRRWLNPVQGQSAAPDGDTSIFL